MAEPQPEARHPPTGNQRSAVLRVRMCKGNIDFTQLQTIEEFKGVRLLELKLDVRISASESPNDPWDICIQMGRARETKPQASGLTSCCSLHIIHGKVCPGEDTTSFMQKDLPCLSDFRTARRLSDTKPERCTSKVQLLGNSNEVSKVAEFHLDLPNRSTALNQSGAHDHTASSRRGSRHTCVPVTYRSGIDRAGQCWDYLRSPSRCIVNLGSLVTCP